MRLLWEGAALRSMCQFSCVSGGGYFLLSAYFCVHIQARAHTYVEKNCCSLIGMGFRAY